MVLTKTAPKTDKQIQLDVLADIARDFRFKPAEIGVEVDAGIVTLTGTVSSYPKLGLAARYRRERARREGCRERAVRRHRTRCDP